MPNLSLSSRASTFAVAPLGHRSLQVSLLVVTLLTAIDQTIVATALPSIVDDVGGRAGMGWVFAGYTLAMTATMPVYGRLGDLQGRRQLFLGCLIGFVVASALCGVATTMTQLIGLRALQGVAGGGVLVLSQAVVADAVSPRDRGRFMAPVGLIYATSSVLGPLVGGALTETVGWRWIFWVNIPVGAVAVALAFRSVPHPVGPRAHGRLDVRGSILYVAAVSGLVVLTGTLGRELAWRSPWALAGVAVTSLCAGLFVVRMLRHQDPLIPVGVLRNRNVVIASCLGFAVGAAVFALVGYVPTIVQEVLSMRPASSGALLLALVMGMMVSTTTTARWTARTGRYRRLPLAGCATCAVALAYLAGLDDTWEPWQAAAGLFVLGVGVGCFMMLVVTVAQDAVSSDLVGSATSTVNLVRELGVTIGAATIGSVLAAGIAPRLPALFLTLAAVFVVGAGLSLMLPDRTLSERGVTR
ncbi:MFS transporter [Nocardioides sp. LS1]|uniref:MFS transporter n=1 Tax=Nocardioides sp. LS1 TaxID=1027620 RepID=UPI00163AA831|nr:MFS transporter [Nocardioides sp. LS1]